ncbi:tyrosine-type recombinase/integrase [Thioclava sp. DLFJ4-1]|uniref:tyrosine-type recombinase/integrase n=1 Tax=Thioclava sp. DLFJ4-1 TaxID=1915313 RepID=UPI0009974047|nr:tyrosine-type recombinase/integrase [Thioclava sp. DLFJ4-1]OOY15109.1 hypothetical protein BMI85_16310 [Thioclava sp. DLFJ4-1]
MRLKIKWINGWAHLHGTGPTGKRIRQSLKTRDPKQAEEKRAAVESKLWKADLYGPEEIVTFDAAAVAYAEDGGEIRFLMKMAQQFEGIRLRDIKPRDIREAAKRAYPKANAATWNRQGITPAQSVINWSHEQGWCAPIKVRRFKVEKPKRKAVGPEYLDALEPYMPDRLFALMLFLQVTGRRVGEAVRMEPHWISGNHVHIPKTKNGEAADVVMPTVLSRLVHAIEPRHGLVFGYVHRSSVYNTLRRACKKAGVEYLGTHQPGRHSFATQLLNQGWQSSRIAKAGGWKSVALVAQIYEHPENAPSEASEIFGKIWASRDDDDVTSKSNIHKLQQLKDGA